MSTDNVFYKLVQAKDTDPETIACITAADPGLLEHYMCLDTEEGGPEEATAEEIDANGLSELTVVNTVMCMQDSVYTDTITAYKAVDGTMWADADLCDDLFA